MTGGSAASPDRALADADAARDPYAPRPGGGGGGNGGGRGRSGGRVARGVLLTLAGGLVLLLVSWFVPWGSHAAYDALDDPATLAALAAQGEVRPLAGSPKGPMQARANRAVSLALTGGGRVSVVAFRYRSGTAAYVRAWLMAPQRNAVAWDEPGKRTPPQDEAWGLPGRAKLVGLLCQSGTHEGQCDRWVVWWPRGADVVLLDLSPGGLTTADDAAARLRPIWEALT